MGTSAIGPGFLTQTAVFTQKLAAAFAFAVLISVLINSIIQINIWRILGVSGLRAQDVANRVCPGLGYFLAFAVCLGGFFFNIGNVGGAALGLEALFGVPHVPGALASAAVAVILFLNKEMGKAMDSFVRILGCGMIFLVVAVVLESAPPIGLALQETVAPSQVDWFTILTLVGGTVGGYISFAGAHRIIDAGVVGTQNLRQISIGAIQGIAFTGIMRYLLFLTVLGVVAAGASLDPKNPAADAFRAGAGEIGYRVFGLILWSAAITSVVGASYTSASFLRSLFPCVEQYHRLWIIGFILCSTFVFISVGRPVAILVAVGSLNALILPLSLIAVLLASRRAAIVGEYRHPLWMTISGYLTAAFTAWLGVTALGGMLTFLQ